MDSEREVSGGRWVGVGDGLAAQGPLVDVFTW